MYSKHSDKIWQLILWGIFLFIVVSLFYYSNVRHFGFDEFEHIHTGWKISQGYQIFIDFFQHHHPFFDYFLVPIIGIYGETTETLMLGRLVMFLMLSGILIVTYLLALRLFKKPEIGVLSLILAFTVVFFYQTAIEIRPDVPQALFGLLSLYFLYSFYDKKGLTSLALSSIFLAFSFLILQKSIFLVFLIGLVLLYNLYKKEIQLREFLIYIAVFLLCISPYYIYLLLSGTFEQYFLLNWLVNIYYPEEKSVRMPKILGSMIRDNLITFVLYIIGFAAMLRYRVRVSFALLTLGLLIMTLALLIPGRRQFILVTPLIVIVAAYGLHAIFKNKIVKLIVLILALSIPIYEMHGGGFFNMNTRMRKKQLKRVNYVLSITEPGDKVYDGNIKFNIYRDDIDFFWFCMKDNTCLDAYRMLTGYEYDIYELISKERPKVISTFRIPDMNHETISNYYVPSEEYKTLLIRKE